MINYRVVIYWWYWK